MNLITKMVLEAGADANAKGSRYFQLPPLSEKARGVLSVTHVQAKEVDLDNRGVRVAASLDKVWSTQEL